MLTIRLQRIGKKKAPAYRLIISEKGRDTRDRYLENLGTFSPLNKENAFQPKADRISYWLSKGAQSSGTVHNLLLKAGLIQGQKAKSVFLSVKRKAKIAEKSTAKAAADAKAVADAKAALEAKVAEAEKPAAPSEEDAV